MNNNTDITLDVVFSRFRGFSFKKNPEAEAQRRESIRVTPLGFCLRVTVNEKPLKS